MNLLLLFFRFVDFVRRRRMKIKSYLTKKKIILYLENHNVRFSKDNFQIDPSTILNFRGGMFKSVSVSSVDPFLIA